jgi:membrane protease subunit HflK
MSSLLEENPSRSVPRRWPARLAHLVFNNGGRNEGPPDLDELWRDFNRKLSGLFGRGGSDGGGPEYRGGGSRGAGIGLALGAIAVALIWLGSGFFMVQEGQQAVVTTVGRYAYTADAGWHWRFPYPFQAHETVPFTQLRTREIGKTTIVQATGLHDSSMLTEDENIVDIRFTVQYRLKDARAYLFDVRDPDGSVEQAAESAVREIVGRSKVDSVLYEQRDAIAADLVKSIQSQLDRLEAGIVVVNVNVQSVQVPEQVQQAFNDAFKAGADRDRLKNEGLAYASNEIPKAQGTASRLRLEADAYKARVIAQAEGDAERFNSVLTQYQHAPAVTRDRLYIDTMREVFSNVSKVYIDTHSNSNLLYLPLDKLLQPSNVTTVTSSPVSTVPAAPAAADPAAAVTGSVDLRSRDNQRSRDRDSR